MKRPKLKCPDCESTNITSCPGGTCLKPNEWARRNIKYICMDCLCEFGDPDSEAPEAKLDSSLNRSPKRKPITFLCPKDKLPALRVGFYIHPKGGKRKRVSFIARR